MSTNKNLGILPYLVKVIIFVKWQFICYKILNKLKLW